jgi:predicted XRE-type DNA-binding protein
LKIGSNELHSFIKRNMGKKVKKNKRKVVPEKIEYEVSSGNVFKDFGYANPEEAKAKWDLAFLIRSIMEESCLTQEQAAELMGIDQPKVSKITRGILSEFTLERLMRYLVCLGYDVEIKAAQSRSATASIHVGRRGSYKRTNA